MAFESLYLDKKFVSKAFSSSFAFGRWISKSNNPFKPAYVVLKPTSV
jgi:hypothetical protein